MAGFDGHGGKQSQILNFPPISYLYKFRSWDIWAPSQRPQQIRKVCQERKLAPGISTRDRRERTEQQQQQRQQQQQWRRYKLINNNKFVTFGTILCLFKGFHFPSSTTPRSPRLFRSLSAGSDLDKLRMLSEQTKGKISSLVEVKVRKTHSLLTILPLPFTITIIIYHFTIKFVL